MNEYAMLNEIGIGIIALLLVMLTAGLAHYIYTHRVTMTVADRDARLAAIGLATVFGALAIRSIIRWLSFVDARDGLRLPDILTSSPFFVVTLLIAMVGAILTMRAFHEWPIWAAFVATSVLIPVLVALA